MRGTQRTDRTHEHPGRRLLVALAVVALVASACSDDDGEDTSDATTAPVVGDPSGDEGDGVEGNGDENPDGTTDPDDGVDPDPEMATTTCPPAAGSGAAALPDTATLPTIGDAVTGGTYDVPFLALASRMADTYGYTEDEYFISGTAQSYEIDGEWALDGEWGVQPADTAEYTTRILVRRPVDPAAFNGTVYVEWLNVSAGMDADAQWGLAHEELLRCGYGYIAVSAQRAGLFGGGFAIPIEGFDITPVTEWDPERYGSLEHPGDEFAFDIFTQGGATALATGEGAPFDGYEVERVIAGGESQSAIRMVTYVNAVHPVADLYDGFLVHSRGALAAPVQQDDDGLDALGAPAIRTDLDVPVMQFQTESDMYGVLGFAKARQEDADLIRTWEVAGAAHADGFVLEAGIESGQEWSPGTDISFEDDCGVINYGTQPLVLRSALRALDVWIRDGIAPAASPLLESEGEALARAEDGIVLGGIRTPAVDVPIAVHSGETGPDASFICILFGSTRWFTQDELAERYPSHDDYVAMVQASADEAVDAGWLLAEDAEALAVEAEAADIGA